MNLDILLSPPIAFLLAMAITWLVYGFGALLGPALNPTPGKLEPYACGEDFEAEKFSFGYRRFFVAALFFTIMHVAVLSVATVPGGAVSFRAIAYLVVIAASIAILYSDVD
jgi:NADH:ubiquinone oxidoreductase subunit 3 (subunit A)